ncbi:hypothetical protein AOXY_G5422 [Acipenser oxyrinchus oxyrinchus]|uniref:Uncharacterized protein n=1 Tax=Acipenser oxyrinchus oxyrinchus TaxID=40147 RepID=A0AAD8GEP6_ACIOX|nr:hypothetical protein AOXY_G5422 [Acipenser oxyrinchus oxyrinchus]
MFGQPGLHTVKQGEAPQMYRRDNKPLTHWDFKSEKESVIKPHTTNAYTVSSFSHNKPCQAKGLSLKYSEEF